MINKEFIPYEQAIKLKTLGFDEACFMYWRPEMDGSMQLWYHSDSFIEDAIGSNNSDKADWVVCTAPLYQQAFDFFLKNYSLHASFYPDGKKWKFEIKIIGNEFHNSIYVSEEIDSYDEAKILSIKTLLNTLGQHD